MPWSLKAQASGTQPARRKRTPRDRERDAQRASKAERGYGSEWQHIRRRIIARDGRACHVCGSSGYLVVHHVNHVPQDNDDANLMTLCRDCHERIHGRRG
mgnify:FL=1